MSTKVPFFLRLPSKQLGRHVTVYGDDAISLVGSTASSQAGGYALQKAGRNAAFFLPESQLDDFVRRVPQDVDVVIGKMGVPGQGHNYTVVTRDAHAKGAWSSLFDRAKAALSSRNALSHQLLPRETWNKLNQRLPKLDEVPVLDRTWKWGKFENLGTIFKAK